MWKDYSDFNSNCLFRSCDIPISTRTAFWTLLKKRPSSHWFAGCWARVAFKIFLLKVIPTTSPFYRWSELGPRQFHWNHWSLVRLCRTNKRFTSPDSAESVASHENHPKHVQSVTSDLKSENGVTKKIATLDFWRLDSTSTVHSPGDASRALECEDFKLPIIGEDLADEWKMNKKWKGYPRMDGLPSGNLT